MKKAMGERMIRAISTVMFLMVATPYAARANPTTRQIVVALNGGGDFTNPIDAVNSITDASASNPYIVKILPGVYNISGDGHWGLWMKPYVDLEGSGSGVTILQGDADYLVLSASNSEIRSLAIHATTAFPLRQPVAVAQNGDIHLRNVAITLDGVGCVNIAVLNNGSQEVVLTDVGISVAGGPNSVNSGIWGSSWSAASTLLQRVSISVSGGSSATGAGADQDLLTVDSSTIVASGSSTAVAVKAGQPHATITNSTLTATGGNSYGINYGYARVHGSRIAGGTYAVYTGGNIQIAGSQVTGATGTGYAASITCVNTYDANFNAYACSRTP